LDNHWLRDDFFVAIHLELFLQTVIHPAWPSNNPPIHFLVFDALPQLAWKS